MLLRLFGNTRDGSDGLGMVIPAGGIRRACANARDHDLLWVAGMRPRRHATLVSDPGSDRSLTVAARPEHPRGSLAEVIEVKALPEAA